MSRPAVWTQEAALALCIELEKIAPAFGCHVALTGGLLYKTGMRKDCDVLFYRIRQTPEIDIDGLFDALAGIGFVKVKGFGWCHKAEYQGKPVDCFFPETPSGDYLDQPESHEVEVAF
jgi:hypothetical protein